jgi:thioredoxin-related protein
MRILILLGVLLFSNVSFGQTKINWITIEEAYRKNQITPKKTIIDVYTDWCGWCKVMDKNTFSNPEVIKYINANYYAVKLDAEGKKDIKIGNNIYKYDEQYKANKAAIALLNGQMSYPSLVYLDEKFNLIQPIAGYQDAKAFHPIITYFGGNYHKKEQFETYKSGTYAKAYKDIKL